MALEIRKYNVLALEPEDIVPELRIANGLLKDLHAKSFGMRKKVSEWADKRLITPGITLEQFAVKDALTFIDDHRRKEVQLETPEEERFYVNVNAYDTDKDENLKIPGRISEFAKVYNRLANDGIDVLFINTASRGEETRRCLSYLAENTCTDFPELGNATWIVTSCLRYPMPDEFFRMLLANCDGKLTDPVSRNLAVHQDCRVYGVPFGDSLTARGAADSFDVVYERLKYLRKDPTRHFKKVEGGKK